MISKNGKKPTIRAARGLKLLGRALAALQLAMAAVLGVRLAAMNVLPAKYMAAYIAGVAAAAALSFLAAGRKKPIPAAIVSVLVTCGLACAFAAVSRLDDTLQKVSVEAGRETVEMAVVALSDSHAETLADMGGQIIGYMEGDEGFPEVRAAIDDAVAISAAYEEHGDVLSLADALLDGHDGAIILNSAYIDMISEQGGYEGFSQKIRILHTAEVEAPTETGQSGMGMESIPLTEPSEESDGEGIRLSSEEDAFIMYISGIDTFGSINVRSRSDVNILLALNMEKGCVQLINTPRDYYVSLPDRGADKLTHAGLYGVECSKSALEDLYGIQIDYFLRVNFSGFEGIIDSLGGVDVYSQYDFSVEPIRHYTVGYNHLSGIEALAFARERYSFASGDVQRGENQMEVIKAVIAKALSADMIANYSDILDGISDCFQTDMPPDVIYDLVRYQLSNNVAWQVDSYTVKGSGSHEATYSMPGATSYVMIPDEEELAEARRLIENVLTGE